MALDMNMDLKGILSRKKKSNDVIDYPDKASMNFIQEKKEFKFTPKTALFLVVCVVAIACFAKFAIFDVISMASAKNGELAELKGELSILEKQNEGYEDLQMELARYGAGGLSVDERSLAVRSDLLTLLDETVGPRTDVQFVSVKSNVIEIRFVNAELGDVSDVVRSLEASDLVNDVDVTTTKYDESTDVVTTVKVATGELQDASEKQSTKKKKAK